MDINKLLGIALIVVGLFDMLVLPRLVPALPDAIRTMLWTVGVLMCAAGALLVLGNIRITS